MSKTANATSKSVPPATSTYDREAIAKLLRSANRGKLNLTEKEVIATYKSLKGVAPAEFLNDPANKIRVGKKDVLDITPFYSDRAGNRGGGNRPAFRQPRYLVPNHSQRQDGTRVYHRTVGLWQDHRCDSGVSHAWS